MVVLPEDRFSRDEAQLLMLQVGRSTCSINLKEFEPPHDETNKIACVPSEDSDQPGHPPSLITVFAVRSVGSLGPKLTSCGQRRL